MLEKHHKLPRLTRLYRNLPIRDQMEKKSRHKKVTTFALGARLGPNACSKMNI